MEENRILVETKEGIPMWIPESQLQNFQDAQDKPRKQLISQEAKQSAERLRKLWDKI